MEKLYHLEAQSKATQGVCKVSFSGGFQEQVTQLLTWRRAFDSASIGVCGSGVMGTLNSSNYLCIFTLFQFVQ